MNFFAQLPGDKVSKQSVKKSKVRSNRWHCSLKNQILLENYYLPGELEARIERFVDYYNNDRSHESLNNLTPVDVYFGRGESTLARRQQIKLNTMAMRRKMHERNRVEPLTLMS